MNIRHMQVQTPESLESNSIATAQLNGTLENHLPKLPKLCRECRSMKKKEDL
jgi:hypothetical protein